MVRVRRVSEVSTWEHEELWLRKIRPRPRPSFFRQKPEQRLDCPARPQMQPLPAAQIQTRRARKCFLRELYQRWGSRVWMGYERARVPTSRTRWDWKWQHQDSYARVREPRAAFPSPARH